MAEYRVRELSEQDFLAETVQTERKKRFANFNEIDLDDFETQAKMYATGGKNCHVAAFQNALAEPTSTNNSYECLQASQERLATAKCACEKNNITYKRVRLTYFVISKKYKFMFELIPKVSSTTWKRYLFEIDPECQQGPRSLELLNITEADLEHYTKVVFVREPLERLVSFYFNNLYYTTSVSQNNKQFDDAIKKIGLRNHSVIQVGRKGLIYNITFLEFAQLIIYHDSKKKHYLPLSGHLEKQNDISRMCSVNYDFIGHLEHLGEDATCFLQLTGLDKLYSFPRIHKQKGKTRYTETLSNLPPDILKKLIEVYRLDYELLGYQIPNFH
uniref:Carbohydrate sulfotransferase n=1 Tax=Saccoglossus kowalevskii TaxID=10224 RepID=A0ABM0MQV3_SACKO|nr:PREDICTED: carbohydrate sulfotransferase 11-like [Saccoglossus kowalevskii]